VFGAAGQQPASGGVAVMQLLGCLCSDKSPRAEQLWVLFGAVQGVLFWCDSLATRAANFKEYSFLSWGYVLFFMGMASSTY
jgi:hypothetical protein